MKKYFILILVALCSVTTMQAYDFEVGGLYYNKLTSSTVEVTYAKYAVATSSYTGAIVVPNEVTYDNNTYTVTAIGDYAFYDCGNLTAIDMPSTITSLGTMAFWGCYKLEEVVVPEKVTTIANSLFYECTSLKKVDLPDGITSIADMAFQTCTSLTDIKLPSALTSIGVQAFVECASLTTIDIPDKVTQIGQAAFNKCTSLSVVNITESSKLRSIGSNGLRGTPIATLLLPSTFTTLNSYALRDCTELLSIYSYATTPPTVGTGALTNVPSNCIIYVPAEAYALYLVADGWSDFNIVSMDDTKHSEGETFEVDGLYYLVVSSENKTVEVTWGGETTTSGTPSYTGNITIPDTVIYDNDTYTIVGVSDNAFCNSTLEGITLPSTATYIDAAAFYGCEQLKAIDISNVSTLGHSAFYGCTSLGSVTLCASLTTINQYLFAECSALSAITLPNSLTTISEGAFQNAGLTAVTIPTAVKTIGNYAFDGCSSMTTATIGSTVTCSLGEYLFRGCTLLDNVDLGTGVKTIGTYAFAESPLKHVTMSNVTTIESYAFYESGLEEVEVPKSVTSIGTRVFLNCVSLKTATVYSGVTDASLYLFRGCTSLTDVVLGEGIPCISQYMFCECTALKNVNIPSTVTSIEFEGFTSCESLEEITIPSSVTFIAEYAFIYCYGLKKINLSEGLKTIDRAAFYSCSSLEEITLPNSLTSVGIQALAWCSSLKEIVIPSSITTIPQQMLVSCTSLEKVTLHDKLTTIGPQAFGFCYSLKEIVLPASVTELQGYTFYGCTSLLSVYSYATTPPTCDKYEFFDVDLNNCALFVPSSSKSLYAAADTWKDFVNIVGLDEHVVYTWDATQICKETALLNGSVRSGDVTEDITSRGFVWWQDESNKFTIEVSGDIDDMSTTLEGLSPDNTYTYCTYLTSSIAGTIYGDEISFSTANRDADFCIDDIFYVYAEGNGTCEVTYENTAYNTYSGDVVVPATTLHNGEEYTVVAVGERAFEESIALTSISLPNTISSIAIWAFYGCTSLTEVVIPDGVTSIGNQAFNACTALTSVTIGSAVESIGVRAFGCINLRSLASLSTTPPVCQSNTFNEVDKNSCILSVPIGSKSSYASATAWQDFYNIVEIDPTGIGSVLTDGAQVDSYYTISGQKVNSLRKGINIIRFTDGTTKKIYIK